MLNDMHERRSIAVYMRGDSEGAYFHRETGTDWNWEEEGGTKLLRIRDGRGAVIADFPAEIVAHIYDTMMECPCPCVEAGRLGQS